MTKIENLVGYLDLWLIIISFSLNIFIIEFEFLFKHNKPNTTPKTYLRVNL